MQRHTASHYGAEAGSKRLHRIHSSNSDVVIKSLPSELRKPPRERKQKECMSQRDGGCRENRALSEPIEQSLDELTEPGVT